ncbi:SMC-Scp complex subunit ScpB [Gleimia europaea]|uniref:Segregation and condensation protein B n=1 Tax=Gleimia europaea ACS-120-V-Col10b TaxID=883069 RepID=A0A9W5VW28_9ACTO|nr:SMC-Scp complex subunit ScpB [Gleimia europaea]EPD30498.1 segregation and condensation protein B [Gleimia europaea ACS-120-V-Col10b]
MQEAIPQIFGDEELARVVEAILMVAPEPVAAADIASTLSVSTDQVEAVLVQLRAEYDRDERGFELREVGGGWRYYSRPTYDPFVSQFVSGSRLQKLSQAALETLAVIAYRQPVTRQKVSSIRGVNVDSVIRSLLARGLIESAGETASGATLFQTTTEFLERMGLRSLDELSPLAPHLPHRDELFELAQSLEK